MKRFKKKRDLKQSFNKLQDDGDKMKDQESRRDLSTRYVMGKMTILLIHDLSLVRW